LEWLRGGGEWFDISTDPPADWDALAQGMAAFYPIRFATSNPRNPIMSDFHKDLQLTELRLESSQMAG